MSEHVTTSQIDRFSISALPEGELITIAEHLASCQTCHELFTETLARQKGSKPLSFTLAPEFWVRHEHLDYEQLADFADEKLDATEREIVDLHLELCSPCREHVRSFLESRKQAEKDMRVSYAPVGQKYAEAKWSGWLRRPAWTPRYAAAVLVIVAIGLVITALVLRKRTANLEARRTQPLQVSPGTTNQRPTPDDRTVNLASSPVTPNESPSEKPNSGEARVVLNDRGGTITVDRSGNVTGLDDVPAPTREEIAKVLLSERLEQPAIVRELGGQEGSLRGSKNGQPFKLTSPSRTVIFSDRPSFKWEKASGASSYRVYVNDLAGLDVARSEELQSERTEWTLPKPLKRGEIYAWAVVAVVDGKEIVSPSRSSPEMKFQVLPLSSLRELNHLKKTRSHLALAVFYTKLGLIDAAEREFQELIRLNPNDTVTKKLLRSVRLIRGTPR